MYRVSLPFTDWSLVLSPRWGDLDPPAQVALLAALGLVPLALVLWLYWHELHLVRRRSAALLLALRLVVVALLWAVVAWQPILFRSSEEEMPGRVLVAVDHSGSMGVADPQRSPADSLRLARALKAAGVAEAGPLLDEWIACHEGKRALPAAGRELHDRITAAVDRMSRAEVARRLLTEEGAGLLGALGTRHRVDLIAFDRDTWELRPEQLGGADAARPGASFTDLRAPLLRAGERPGPDGARTLGVVLLTDGQHNHGDSPLKRAAELAGCGVPVYPVAVGARRPPQDISVLEISAPSSVMKDVDAPVEVRFRVSGLPAQDLVVELRQGKEDPRPEHVQRVKHDGADRVYSVPFRVRPGEPGLHSVAVSVTPTLPGTREASTKNNRRTAAVRVIDDRARVLLIDGEARWEYHYLATALRRDRGVQADLVVFSQPRIGRIAEEDLEKAGNPRLTLPRKNDTEDPLLKYDCVVLGDVAPQQLSAEDRARLERFVADRGGTLVILAGKRYLPLAFAAGPEASEDPLLKMLPVESPRAVTPAAGFPVSFTEEGRQAPFLQMADTPEESARRWAELPRHFWGLVGRPKPGAVTLAYVAGAADTGIKDDPEKSQALIVRHGYGFGRVLLVGLDSTWRWRYRVGDTYHHRFWGQLVRWAASDQVLPAGNRFVRYGSRDPVYRRGQEAAIVARLEDGAALPPESPAAARIWRVGPDGKEEPAALVGLARNERQPRLLEGAARDLPPGEYRIELHIPALEDRIKDRPGSGEGQGQARRDTFAVIEAEGGESVNLATNWALLESLASTGKGELLTPEDAGRLVELLQRQVQTRPKPETQRVWQDPPLVWILLGGLLTLLAAEWVGRKLAGLP